MIERKSIGDTIFFNSVLEDKFKNNILALNFILPLKADEVCKNAIVPILLRDCEDILEFNKKQKALYDAQIDVETTRVAGAQKITISIKYLKDKYTLGKENIALKAINLLLGSVMKPLASGGRFGEEHIQREKAVLADLIRSELNDKIEYAKKRCEELMFEGTSCAINPNGTASEAEKLLADEICQAYFRVLQTARIEVVYVGDAHGSSVAQEALAREFEGIKSPGRVACRIENYDFREELKTLEEKLDVAQAKLALGFVKPAEPNKQSRAQACIMANIYGGSPVSRLFCNVRERLSLCYYCSAKLDNLTGSMVVNSGVEQGYLDLAQEAIIKEFEEMKAGKFTQDDLEKAKLDYKNRLRRLGDSLEDLADWYSSGAFMEDLITPGEFCQLVDKTTAQDVVDQARKFKLTTKYLLRGNG